jgi:glycosyltransferase involved in cell wall biosynthesis
VRTSAAEANRPAPPRLLVVTSFFPNSADPLRTLFVRNLVDAMRADWNLEVVAPVPFVPPLARYVAQRRVGQVEMVGEISVEHPRYLVVPRLGWLSGLTYGLAIRSRLRRFKREAPDGLIHVHCAYPDAVGVAWAARLAGLPFVVTAHGSDINVYAQRRGWRGQIRWALARANAVVAVSQALYTRIESLLGDRAKQIAWIPCAGYNPSVFYERSAGAIRTSLGIAEAARVVLFVGQLVGIKDTGSLVRAWTVLHQSGRLDVRDRLVFIGEGPCRERDQEQARAAHLESSVLWLGGQKQGDVARWMAACDVLCLCSRNEGTPNVVIEALACGRPVVATAVGGVPEVVTAAVNGLLVPPGETDKLAEALAQALDRTWDSRRIAASVGESSWSAIAQRNRAVLMDAWQRRRA